MTEGKEKGMTFKEMLERDYPPTQIERVMLDLCPEDLGYEDNSPCPGLVGFMGEADAAACMKCWGREASGKISPLAALGRNDRREGDLE